MGVGSRSLSRSKEDQVSGPQEVQCVREKPYVNRGASWRDFGCRAVSSRGSRTGTLPPMVQLIFGGGQEWTGQGCLLPFP